MVIPGKVLTTYLDLRTKRPNKKQKPRFSITDITKQYFMKFIKKFYHSPYLVYKIKQVHNKPNEAYLFLVKHITEIIKIKTHVPLRTNFIKLGANKIIV